MSQIIQTEVFTFAELSDEAKEKAREWYREGGLDYDWWDCTYEDAKQCAKILGIEIDNIYFSGFWSQGAGACFEGSYSYQRGAAHAIRKHAPEDSTLHSIADDLQAIQKKHAYNLTARVKQRGRYSHEYATEIDVLEHGNDAADEESRIAKARPSSHSS